MRKASFEARIVVTQFRIENVRVRDVLSDPREDFGQSGVLTEGLAITARFG